MIITRDVINKNITFFDYDLSDNIIEYSYDDISRKVNFILLSLIDNLY